MADVPAANIAAVQLAGTKTSDNIDAGNSMVEAGFVTAESVVLTTDFPITINNGIAKGLYIGVEGDVTVITPNGETITYPAVANGFQPIPCSQVMSSANGTAATGIVAGAW